MSSSSPAAPSDPEVEAGRLGKREAALGVALAGTSGAAVLAHAFGPLPLSFSAPFVVLPAAALLAGLALLRRGRYRQLRGLADLLLRGGAWGLAATLLYDAVRPAIRLVFGYAYDPYRAMPIFGQLITGQADTPLALAAGWTYHFWNGISFGMILALLRPRGGALAGLAWGLGLQVLMMVTYPTLLRIRLEDPGFLVSGLVGHGVWGLALGAGLRRDRVEAGNHV